MYRIPWRVATTTALAVGGLQPVGGLPPIPPTASFQDIFNTTAVTLVPAAQSLVAWAAVPGGQQGVVTHLALFSTDPTVVTYQTRVNGVGVSPYTTAHLGSLGMLLTPFPLPQAIPLRAGDVFDIVVTNTGAANIDFQTRSMGAFFV
jgi:hypothetical protein